MGRSKKSVASIAAAAARSATAAALEGAEEGTELEVLDGTGDPEEIDALEQLKEIGEGSADCKFVLTCLAPLDRRGKIDELAKEDLQDLWQYVRDTFGPGKYSVHAVVGGRYVKSSRQVIQISTLAKQRGAAPGAPATPAASAASDMQQYLRDQEAREERRRLEAREDRKFMLQLAISALPALQGLLRPPSLADQAAAMQAIVALKGGDGASTEKMLDTLMKGLELGKELNGGGSADSWPGVIREVVKDLTPGANTLLTQIAERRAAAAGAPGAPAPRGAPRIPYQPAPVPVSPASPAANPPSENLPSAGPEVTDPMLRSQLPLLNKLAEELLEFAANGADPGLCAEALVAKVPRAVRAFVTPEQLREWLTYEQWWSVLEAFKPALKPYQGYCDDVRQTLLKLMSEPESEPENP